MRYLEYAVSVRCVLYIWNTANTLQYSGAQNKPPEMDGPFVGLKKIQYIDRNLCCYWPEIKNPAHGRKLCSLFTAKVQYTKIEKLALKLVLGSETCIHDFNFKKNTALLTPVTNKLRFLK